MPSPSQLDFRIHAVRLGSDDAGRVDFHRMLTALIQAQHPTATEVRADPGDWGIDVFVGSLVDKINIWQSKYFYDEIGDSQKRQIRESFASAMKNAATHEYVVETWTLCVACELSAPERKWWDGKVREWGKAHPKLVVDLLDAPRLRKKLMAPEVRDVWNEFYANWQPSNDQLVSETVVGYVPPISDEPTPDYSDALFVKQMQVAGVTTLDAQLRAFFNAELVARDVESRAIPEHLAAVSEIDTTLLGIWEDSVADPATTPTASEYEMSARRLFSAVMKEMRAVPPPKELPIRPLHSRGFMHRIVDEGRAGWVHDWATVATEHTPAEDATNLPIADLTTSPTVVETVS